MARTDETWKVAVEGAALATELHSILKVSHRQAKGLIDGGCVKVNGQEASSYGLRLKADDGVAVSFDPERVYDALPRPSKSKDIPFQVLWEDKHLVFVNKPAGLLTVPAEKHHDPCLAEAITDHYRRRGFKRFHLFIAHRLDRYTSGVLVFAKTPEALNGLKNIFEDHHLHRIYKAILVGELPENAGTLTDKLVERKSLKMDIVPSNSNAKHDIKGAKIAVTHYRVLERLPGHTVVEVKLETGRRNQIRVQFADRGFALLGDQVYGVPSPLIDRQALHAELLGFRHPVSEETVTVTAPMPADMEKVLKTLRNVRRVVRAEAGTTGEEGIYKPRITKDRKNARHERAERFTEPVREAAPERPKRGFLPQGEERPRRAFSPQGDERPKRTFSPQGEERPKRAFSPQGEDRPKRTSAGQGEERPQRTFTPRPRTANGAPRPDGSGVVHAYIHPEAPKAAKPRSEAAKAPRTRPAGKPATAVRSFAARKPRS